jgi:protein-tyrosine kinase
MSRIEKALEKAVKLRESMQGKADKETSLSEPKVPFAGFDAGEGCINTEMVDRYIVCMKEPRSFIAEQYKKLCARIIKDTAKDFLNTIMVSSPDMGEGKTITALNLSLAIANEIDYSVLLVDADLRQPSVHKYLGLESKLGLSDYLMGKAGLQDILVKTGIGKLVILPSGNPSENTSELLASERMRKLVHDMKHRYKDRYIIFDSSPILVSADALPLSSYMDGIVLVIQALHTTQNAASNALSLIKGTKVLGIVFNDVPNDLAKNLYPYYYLDRNEKYYKKSITLR